MYEWDNSRQGQARLVRYLNTLTPILIVLEASGGYERQVCEAMQAQGLPVHVAQPGCVRHFAQSQKVLAKTDKIDARVIARFGQAVNPSVTPKVPQNVQEFRAICDRRSQIVEDRVREENRLEKCCDPRIARCIKASVRRLQRMEEKLDQQIAQLLKEDQQFAAKYEVITELKGVGRQTAATLLAYFPELGALSRQQVAAFAGLAPYANESGKWKGRRRIYAGRGKVRKALFRAAKSAARWCPVISAFYRRLRTSGKSYKTAIIACARKLIVRINSLLKEMKTEVPAA